MGCKMAGEELITTIKKRDGTEVPFDPTKISRAIYRAMEASGEEAGKIDNISQRVAERAISDLNREIIEKGNGFTPDIEDIQDRVEVALMHEDLTQTARKYILYREDRKKKRTVIKPVSERVRKLTDDSKKYFKGNDLGEFLHQRTYSRWIENEGRRETWIETVDRYVDFMKERLEGRLEEKEYSEVREAILNQKVMPSMRLMWGAGDAVRDTNVIAYNCSFIPPSDHTKDFGEMLYVLMCGTGAGFSVEDKFVQQLPIIKPRNGETLPTHVVGDSKVGWAEAFNLGLQTWYNGQNIDFDFSQVRPTGARLKTMGGRSSGPSALDALLNYTTSKLTSRNGRRLRTLDVHDIECKIGEIVVVGGVRRSAELSLSDLDDLLMRDAKKGQFYLTEGQRSMANNSVAYSEKPNSSEFLKEWLALAESGSGERGIFNRGNLKEQLPERRWNTFKDYADVCGTNPCGEIILRPRQFCNLSEVIARQEDTLSSLKEKIRLATLLGTYQSMLTDFPFLSKEWKENCEEERLLGVSITGLMDSPLLRTSPEALRELREYAIDANRHYAQRFGINESTCITCVKPSGTVSQLVDSSSGGHARHSPFYRRNVRINANDPLFHMLKDQGYPYEPEVGQSMSNATSYVLPFAVESPKEAIFRKDMGAIEQLEMWKMLKQNYTEHNPSVTISVGEEEWIPSGNWVYQNWEHVGGLSFLPRDDHVYRLAPYEELTKTDYHALKSKLPKIDYSKLSIYEERDQTQGAREYACVAGQCEL